MESDLGLWAIPIAICVSTPFLFVSLGEVLTERSGPINLGLEGTLVFGAMSGYAVAFLTGSSWLGVLAAALAGACFGLLHGVLCSIPRVNDIAVGIAMVLLGTGLAFFFGKPFIQPVAPDLSAISFGWWTDIPQLEAALRVNVLFLIGIAAAIFLWWMFRATKVGLVIRAVSDSTDVARAMGLRPSVIRTLATAAGGAFAGVGGAYLSLYYPGGWNEGISSGQGLMAVALVIFARWNPIACFGAALLFGGAGALGPVLQSVDVSQGYYLFFAAPYVLTLGVLIPISSRTQAMIGAPGELSITK